MVTVDRRRGSRGGSPRVLMLILWVLVVSMVAGAAFLVLRRSDAADHPEHPLSDEQSKAQVLEPAREIVAVANLENANGGYILMSCTNQTDPPYQGAIYLTFDLPDATHYLDQVAASLVSHGWRKGSPPNRYLSGIAVSKNGVTAILYRDPDRNGFGIMKVYGECRNVSDHRNDATGWVDISDLLR